MPYEDEGIAWFRNSVLDISFDRNHIIMLMLMKYLGINIDKEEAQDLS